MVVVVEMMTETSLSFFRIFFFFVVVERALERRRPDEPEPLPRRRQPRARGGGVPLISRLEQQRREVQPPEVGLDLDEGADMIMVTRAAGVAKIDGGGDSAFKRPA